MNINNNLKCKSKCTFEEIKNNECILDNESFETKEDLYNNFIDFISNNYNNKDIILTIDDNLIFQLSNSLNEKEKLNNGYKDYNLSIIDYGECEKKSKKKIKYQ